MQISASGLMKNREYPVEIVNILLHEGLGKWLSVEQVGYVIEEWHCFAEPSEGLEEGWYIAMDEKIQGANAIVGEQSNQFPKDFLSPLGGNVLEYKRRVDQIKIARNI
jgi:hypothetical protein